jgi:hypothetical protein
MMWAWETGVAAATLSPYQLPEFERCLAARLGLTRNALILRIRRR